MVVAFPLLLLLLKLCDPGLFQNEGKESASLTCAARRKVVVRPGPGKNNARRFILHESVLRTNDDGQKSFRCLLHFELMKM